MARYLYPTKQKSSNDDRSEIFSQGSPSAEDIYQKYLESGHNKIQEVDSVHSKTEIYIKNSGKFSLIILLKQ
jgi:hypothetical protein